MNKEDLQRMKFLVLDFDGVLTDNLVIIDQDGKESVTCSREDGMGIELLKGTGIEIMVISRERNPVVKRRCEKLGIECIHGVESKLELFRKEVEKRGKSMTETCYVGNDVNDNECIEAAGIGIAVNDAHYRTKAVADHVTERKGVKGGVREIIVLMLP